MESIDQNQAARVWQRVRGQGPEDDGQSLETLITAEWMAASGYLQLSRRVGSREAAMLRRMAEQEQAHCAILKGMYTMMTGKRFTISPGKSPQGTVEELLRKCYAGELKSIAAYEARSRDEEFGAVFAGMRDQEKDHARWVLELLGMMQRSV